MTVIDRIQRLLEARGVHRRSVRRELAKACDISYEAVRQWFSGDTSNIRNEHLVAIASKFHVSVDWLLTGDGERVPSATPGKGQFESSVGEKKGSYSLRNYQDELYESATEAQRAVVDEMADMMLRLSPEQARKLKQAMDLLIPDNGTAKN